MTKKLKVLIILGGVLLLLGGIVLKQTVMEKGKTHSEAEEKPRMAPVQGAFAPDFSLLDLSGKRVEIKEVYEQKALTILNFWATWCGPCRREIPEFNRFYQEYKERGLEIVAVNIGESPAQVREFAQDEGMEFPILLDTKTEVAADYYVNAIPTTFLIDQKGLIHLVHKGTLDYNRLVRVVQEFYGK